MGEVPTGIKRTKVVPTYKQGLKKWNCKLKTSLTIFSKLFERVVYDRLTSYVKNKNILYPFQHVFQLGHSTSMSLLDIHKISMAVDNNEYSVGIFFHLAKAFDAVNHNILLSKLELYGIRGTALE